LTLAEIMASRPNLKFLYFGGKGGVGKTVVSAALAEAFASEGKRTLIASLNPVHSLSSVFGQDLAGGQVRPVEGVPNLFAVEVETRDTVERYRENISRRVREFLRWADIPVDARPFIDIAATNPAFEESAMFDKMVDIMLEQMEAYDRIVFDTAAVANAVRLIGLSKIYGLWLGRLIESRKEALSLRVQLSFRKEKVLDEVRKDPLMADLIAMNDRFLRVKALLTDPERTAFFFVTLPLALPISVVRRFIDMVRAYDIPIGGVVVNEVIRQDILGQGEEDEYLSNKLQEQEGYLETIRRDLGQLVCAVAPLFPGDITGVEAVRRLRTELMSPAGLALLPAS
jgi:arsenite-transporting ATPase